MYLKLSPQKTAVPSIFANLTTVLKPLNSLYMTHKKIFWSPLLVLGMVFYSFYGLMPRNIDLGTLPDDEYSVSRALTHLKAISQAPHYVGSKQNEVVRDYIIDALEDLGLSPQTQKGYIYTPRTGGLDQPVNIIAKIKGRSPGKSLLVFAHYDSALVPSYGASDAGSGVATILEGVRAFLSAGKTPKHDIIILFTDAEEVGLDGAKLFVRAHPWAKDIGLSLNFEARGSGGPSNMIVETNQANKGLIESFVGAGVAYPVASSLMYSVYKLLPNDTDSTILREEADIDGFFFAHIDDHFDYHTANDTYERMDRNTMAHQGSYILPLLHYYSEADFDNLKDPNDWVYTNFPIVKMITFPFSWVPLLTIIGLIGLISLLIWGVKNDRIRLKSVLGGFIPFLMVLGAALLGGFYLWQLVIWLYPHYTEIQQGFPYNGHYYIGAFAGVALAFCFFVYRKASRYYNTAELLFAPLFFWWILNALFAVLLPGAAYHIIPFALGLVALLVCMKWSNPPLLVLTLLCAPAVFIIAPSIQSFPVGLGLSMLFLTTVFTTMLFVLAYPAVALWRINPWWERCLLAGSIVLFVWAHGQSDFAPGREKPNSLLFYQDDATKKAHWVTYDAQLDPWVQSFIGDKPQPAEGLFESASMSKYARQYTYAASAPSIVLEPSTPTKTKDSIAQGQRHVRMTLTPQSPIDVLKIYADTAVYFHDLSFNGVVVAKDQDGFVFKNRKSENLLTFYLPPSDSLVIEYAAPVAQQTQFNVVEFSFDLMTDPQLNVAPRPDDTMTKPFVLNDAVVLRHRVSADALE